MTEWLTNEEVSKLTGLKYSTLYTLRRRATLPEPDTYIGRTPVWKRTTIEEWNNNRKETELELVSDSKSWNDNLCQICQEEPPRSPESRYCQECKDSTKS